ncbi:MAG: hypothetical protein V7K48_32275 [Nostoc sp.]|uniref:hypothetical protein n=1 Tax=Nostoc sp. TaxID=1180 RepID=UPI002FF6A662
MLIPISRFRIFPIKLLTTAQPAIALFTEITLGVVKLLAQCYENVAVQKFYLGLDFD